MKELNERQQITELLQRILDKLDALPRAIAIASHKGTSLTRDDRERLAILLPAIAEAVGNAVFATRDLMDEASADSKLQGAINRVFPNCSPQKLGKLLARSDGFAEDNLRVESAGKAREGVLWRITQV